MVSFSGIDDPPEVVWANARRALRPFVIQDAGDVKRDGL
jgi:hypothetical protein